ncbi:hypothetical protein QMZ20_24560, partial [Serratia bockelmannii]|nr:hypothetical protein [Serratia bockelmannii]
MPQDIAEEEMVVLSDPPPQLNAGSGAVGNGQLPGVYSGFSPQETGRLNGLGYDTNPTGPVGGTNINIYSAPDISRMGVQNRLEPRPDPSGQTLGIGFSTVLDEYLNKSDNDHCPVCGRENCKYWKNDRVLLNSMRNNENNLRGNLFGAKLPLQVTVRNTTTRFNHSLPNVLYPLINIPGMVTAPPSAFSKENFKNLMYLRKKMAHFMKLTEEERRALQIALYRHSAPDTYNPAFAQLDRGDFRNGVKTLYGLMADTEQNRYVLSVLISELEKRGLSDDGIN